MICLDLHRLEGSIRGRHGLPSPNSSPKASGGKAEDVDENISSLLVASIKESHDRVKKEQQQPKTSWLDRHRQHRRHLYCKMFRRPFLHYSSEAFLPHTASASEGDAKEVIRDDARKGQEGGCVPAAGIHPMYRFAVWCDLNDVFIHPTLRMVRQPSSYRDHRFYVSSERIPQHAPLISIPEPLLIGFKDATKDEPAMQFREDADGSGGFTDSDVCSFFFTSLGLLVSDLLVALNSAKTDARHFFANSLHQTRTLHNAPYLEDVVFDPRETCLADVVLQMMKNFINAGPLSGRVSRPELCWASSVSLSHSTPMSYGTRAPSIGIIPFVHLFPHGGERTNCVVLANRGDRSVGKIRSFFEENFQLGFNGENLFVVPIRNLRPGEEAAMQPMAPICNIDDDELADHMWRLSCGSRPHKALATARLASLQDAVFEAVTGLKA